MARQHRALAKHAPEVEVAEPNETVIAVLRFGQIRYEIKQIEGFPAWHYETNTWNEKLGYDMCVERTFCVQEAIWAAEHHVWLLEARSGEAYNVC